MYFPTQNWVDMNESFASESFFSTLALWYFLDELHAWRSSFSTTRWLILMWLGFVSHPHVMLQHGRLNWMWLELDGPTACCGVTYSSWRKSSVLHGPVHMSAHLSKRSFFHRHTHLSVFYCIDSGYSSISRNSKAFGETLHCCECGRDCLCVSESCYRLIS